jgi:hypothetical protein
LRAGAKGSLSAEAAVELLIDHGCWPRRTDFLSTAVEVTPRLDDVSPLLAFVDWPSAVKADLPALSSGRQLVAIAAELAGVDSGQPLGQLVTGWDETNTILVARGVVHVKPRQVTRTAC